MKKSIISLAILASCVSANAVDLGAVNVNPTSTIKSSVEQNQNLISYKYAENNLSDISSANPAVFDNPPVGENGVLERMPSTNIETKYGNMSIKIQNNGYTITNTSNSNAPILYIGGVNNIYRVGGQVDLKNLLTPVLYNSSGDKISGTIIFPNVDTSKANYGAKYIEAIGSNGAITISPFIYNTVDFKNPIVVNSEEDIKSLTPQDILNGPSNNLQSYVAQYKAGDKNIIVGVSRGMSSVREEVPIQIGETSKQAQKQTTKPTQTTQKITDTYKMPLIIKVLTSSITYFVVGIILIALIAFLCF